MTDRANARSWVDLEPSGLRNAFRSAAITGLAVAARMSGRMSAHLERPRVQVLIMHHVFPDEEAGFRALLSALSRHHRLIAYSEAVHRANAGGSQVDRPYIAVTFDDGFKNCLRAAAILEEFDARGMFFVCPSIVGETDRARIERFCAERLQLPKTVDFMDWSDLETLRTRGHEIGGHTMSHVNLAAVPFGESQREIAECREAISTRLGSCQHFAWTYGRFHQFSAALARTVFDARFASCASGERGCHGPNRVESGVPLCLRRDHIVAGWPVNHALYFLARSSARMNAQVRQWPEGWSVS